MFAQFHMSSKKFNQNYYVEMSVNIYHTLNVSAKLIIVHTLNQYLTTITHPPYGITCWCTAYRLDDTVPETQS